MKKNMMKIVAIVIAGLLLLGLVAPLMLTIVYGAPMDATLKEMKEQEQAAIETVQELEKQLNIAATKVYQLEESLKEKEEELAAINLKLEEAEQAEVLQMDKFKKRMTVICETGVASYLDVIFSATSFSDFIDRVVIAREIAEYDNNILDAMERVKEEIRIQKEQMEAIKAQLETEKTELDTALAELEQKTIDATAYMKQLQEDRVAYEAYLDAKEREKQAAKKRAGISSSGNADLSKLSSGMFLWPTSSSYITSHFSPNRVNPVTGVLRPHTGTDVGAGYGEPVWAASGGTVIMAEYNGGYGNCVIISHGNGINTLYGHMSSILVSSGEKVSQGKQIGRIGSTGNSTGPHLHFEVLIDGTAVDPMQFF